MSVERNNSKLLRWVVKKVFNVCLHWGPLSYIANKRPFPSSLVPLFQNECKCETFHMKMSSACSFIFMQIKVVFIRMVSHLDSLWSRSTRELGNPLFKRRAIFPWVYRHNNPQLIDQSERAHWFGYYIIQNNLLFVIFSYLEIGVDILFIV